MNKVCVERLWVPAGESYNEVKSGTHLLVMADGPATSMEWSVNDGKTRKRGRIFSGDTWVCPQGQTSWARKEAGNSCVQLALSADWISEATHSPSFELLPQAHLRDALLAQMLRKLADIPQALSANPTTTLYQESLAVTLVLHLITHYGQRTAKQGESVPLSSIRIQAITDYVAENLPQTISLPDLAQFAGLSVSQFSVRFRDTTGQTPHQFVTAVRVERARELLVAGQHSPAEVALLTGFADQSHLTRHIRRTFGVTPSALRRP